MQFKDDSQQVYSACWWVFDPQPKYYKLREWLTPRKFLLLVMYYLFIQVVYQDQDIYVLLVLNQPAYSHYSFLSKI